MTPGSLVRSSRMRVGRSSRGSAALETVALLPIIIFVGTLLLQVGVAVWTTVAADTAARSAARAFTLHRDPLAAANDSLPGGLRVSPGDIDTVNSPEDVVRVTLRINIPRVSILPTFTVQRDAVMPNITS